MLSGIAHVQRSGLRWRDAPAAYGPHKTLYNRYVRWARAGAFEAILADLSGRPDAPARIMVDATHLKAHRTAASLGHQKGARRIGRTRGGLNTKLHVVGEGGPALVLLLSRGQMSDHKGAGLLPDVLPPARELFADRRYDSDRFRAALEARGIRPCIPSHRNRQHPRPYDRDVHRHRIENMFARLKVWRRIATRYDRCDLFRAAIVFAATVIFWLRTFCPDPGRAPFDIGKIFEGQLTLSSRERAEPAQLHAATENPQRDPRRSLFPSLTIGGEAS